MVPAIKGTGEGWIIGCGAQEFSQSGSVASHKRRLVRFFSGPIIQIFIARF
jgi:hypothetical protein